jgi:hypothetical protein
MHPLQIRVLEGFAIGKAVLNRRVGLGSRRIIRILRHENRTLRPLDEFLNQRRAVTAHDLVCLLP